MYYPTMLGPNDHSIQTHLAVPSIIALAIAGQCVYQVGLVLYPFLQLFHQQARWPSGLRRQLKVLPIRWSERAWVQIPLSSISFCPLYDYLEELRKMFKWVKNRLSGILDMRFVDGLLVCEAWHKALANFVRTIHRSKHKT
jgi:hypothetical protein